MTWGIGVITISDRNLKAGERARIAIDLLHASSSSLNVTGQPNHAEGVASRQAHGTILDGSWVLGGDFIWYATYVPDEDVEATDVRILLESDSWTWRSKTTDLWVYMVGQSCRERDLQHRHPAAHSPERHDL